MRIEKSPGRNEEIAVDTMNELNRSTKPDPLPDPEFELLESYLDGELTPAEVQRLETRLVHEPELSAALGRKGSEHAVRQAVWRSMEPDEAAARVLAAAVAASARRSNLRRLAFKFARVAGAVAACVVLFLAGVGVGRGQAAPETGNGRHRAPLESGGTTRPAEPEDAAAFFHAADKAHPRSPSAGGAPYVYQVALTDEAGNITAVQKFDTLEDAQRFAAEVGRWQDRQQQIQSGKVVVTTSRF